MAHLDQFNLIIYSVSMSTHAKELRMG